MRRVRLYRTWVVAIGCAALVAGLAGCGSSGKNTASSKTTSTSTAGSSSASGESGKSGESGIAYAKEQVTKFKVIPKFPLASAESLEAKKLAGKTIEVVSFTDEIPYVKEVDALMQKIGTEAGLHVKVYSTTGQPTQWAQGIEQGISEHASAIVLSYINPVEVVPQLRDAKKANIPVIAVHTLDDTATEPAAINGLVTVEVTAPFTQSARLSVDYAVAQSGTSTDALIITSEEYPPSPGMVADMKEEFAKTCPSCKFKVVNVPIPKWATEIQPTVQSELSANPNLNWILPLYDSESQYVAAGINAAGRKGQVNIASYNGTQFVLKMIEEKNDVVMDSAENTAWIGYADVDATFRVLAGLKPVAEETPLRIIDESNVAETGTPPVVGKGLGTEYVSAYRKLWGLG